MKKTLLLIFSCLFICGSCFAETAVNFDIAASERDFGNGMRMFWLYGESLPGPLISARAGETVSLNGSNWLSGMTNIHWHGLNIPNKQSGMMKNIMSGQQFSYEFVPPESGTYFYHSFKNPMAQQMEMGLYGMIIIKSADDDKYQGDHAFIVGKHYGVMPGTAKNPNGEGLLVNGRNTPEPLKVLPGDLQKVRFINAMTEGPLTIRMTGHLFRVTHLDGHGVFRPFETSQLEIWPGERIDAEIKLEGKSEERYEIRLNENTVIPIVYGKGNNVPVRYLYMPENLPEWFGEISDKNNFIFAFAEGIGDGKSRRWTVNGKAFPDSELNKIKVNQLVQIRLWNNEPRDTHVVHIQGTKFLVIGENGRRKEPLGWKDTVAIPPASYLDIAFVMKERGDWMVYCQEARHADGGMITVLRAD